MNRTPAPTLDPRDVASLAASLRDRAPAFVPGWEPRPGGAGNALLEVYARYLAALAAAVNAAPDKNELAFLDMLGITVLPAQAARAPVVFTAMPGGGDVAVPAGTRLGSKGPDPSKLLVFETERSISVASAPLAEVVTLWPGRDAYADHTADVLGGRPFTLWQPLQPVAHELYIAHHRHLALTGPSALEIQFDLERPGSDPIALEWTYWDGKLWREFKPAQTGDDGTAGLTRNGRVLLSADCAETAVTAVGGWNSFWVRARVTEPLPPDPQRVLPLVDRIELRTAILRPLTGAGPACGGGLLPDNAFTEGQRIDLTKPSHPLGNRPDAGSAVYLSCAEAFSRPDAVVAVCVQRAKTAEDEADAQGAQFELDVEVARKLLKDARDAAKALKDALDSIMAAEARIDDLPSLWDAGQPLAWYTATRVNILAARNEILAALPPMAGTMGLLAASMIPGVGTITGAAGVFAAQGVIDELCLAAGFLSENPAGFRVETQGVTDKTSQVADDIKFLNVPGAAIHVGELVNAVNGLVTTINNAPTVLPQAMPDLFQHAQDHFDTVKNRLVSARTKLTTAQTDAQIVIDRLAAMSPLQGAIAGGANVPTLSPPKLAWEYWDGSAWLSLNPSAVGTAVDLRENGTFSFTVPHDWAVSTVTGVDALWARGRLASGSYAKLRLVSWTDQQSQAVNFLPIVEPRPPVLDRLSIGYEWHSAPTAPEHTLALNDFQLADHSDDAAWRGGSFAPFSPVSDMTPALYLGFDGPLPADELGIWVDAMEAEGVESGPALEWETWDGDAWRRVAVEDETANLAVPGIVWPLSPGSPVLPAVPFAAASGQEVTLADSRDAAPFTSGQLVVLRSRQAFELAVVADVDGAVVRTRAPLTQAWGQGTLGRAALPRFGAPRSWLRARRRSDGDPLTTRVAGLWADATWAAQVDTVEDELVGSSDGEPGQVFFLSRPPVLEPEIVEVRELDGPRAEVEYPMLVDALARVGISEADLRTVRDARTGQLVEVWVPWRRRDNLAFSGPDDRNYVLERSRGRILFGDGVHGRIPLPARDGIRARRYNSGGGVAGNLPAGAIDRVLGGVLVQGVTNPRRAEGGADGEPLPAVLDRGPLTIRHQRQAVSLADHEALAHEASPAVAVARAVTNGAGVDVVIVPVSADPRPFPTYELRREVHEFLRLRAPASLTGAIRVQGPVYQPVGVRARLAPLDPARGGEVVAAARDVLERFLHPLYGGPAGNGWPFGRDVYLSDVAAALERLDGVDYVGTIDLLLDGSPQGERAAITADRLVAAGPLTLSLDGELG